MKWLFRRLLEPEELESLVGDSEEVWRQRRVRHGRVLASILAWLETIELLGSVLAARWNDPRHVSPRHRFVPFSWLDVRLGLRMLVKYPGLTLVGGLAMSFAIWVCIGGFELYTQLLSPRLPLEDGDRIVGIQMVDVETTEADPRDLYDFGVWQEQLRSVTELGAYRSFQTNLSLGEELGGPVYGAAITSTGFGVARVAPALGRALVADDERPGAPLVVLLGDDVWRSRFGADPGILGRAVRVGDEQATVVGIMPPDFGFPLNQSLWVPLRLDPDGVEPRTGPAVRVFGRLAPGTSLEEAQAELTELGARAARDHPPTHEHLRPVLLPYARTAMGLPAELTLGLTSINVALFLLLALVCGNVALLVFARAAGREAEVVVRSALGASRGRVVGQLFVESLVLGMVAAVVGVGGAGLGLQWFWTTVFQGVLLEGVPPPFWITSSLSPMTLLYVSLLTIVAASVASVGPALKVTASGVAGRLRHASPGGGRMHFSGVWTVVIVAQIALTLAFPVVGWTVRRDAAKIRALDVGFDSERFLTAWLRLPPTGLGEAGHALRFAETTVSLAERLEADASIAAVTFASSRPGTFHPWRRIELDEGGAAPRTEQDEQGPGRWVWGGRVAENFFDVLGTEPIEGRLPRLGDPDSESRVVVVNEAFVDRVLGGRNPIGRHVRYFASDDGWGGIELGDPAGPWYRIVAVVPDLAMYNGSSFIGGAGLYHIVPATDLRAKWMLARTHTEPQSVAPEVRSIAGDVEPTLVLDNLMALERVRESDLRFYQFWFWLCFGVSSITLVLSLAGIYAVMSFTVARRTAEIGIRVALGARSASVVKAIFRRPMRQLGIGVVVGWVLTAGLGYVLFGRGFWGLPLLMTLGYGALMAAVCMTACIVPTRRALGVQPTQALGTD